ncbi:4a-hydroxytetrahydrobiopterin dehydratase [Shimia sp. R10_1]|uniref:4a-hydroxytetrahydrobiopterin dehydratase n=1 Tax=Shimia sp. R10_1 TaxID=2821095 RepID=UPI001ADCEEEC|nr:4a-hydroxytetrahydrobiopterin dehydratase [Shimia sp. R10_1]MBO9472334.1 4a-hydroxytetrahydrobiopterin dehydratase [Shimia sp. R10_1]
MMVEELASKSCAACEGWVPPLSDADLAALKSKLHPDWTIAEDGNSLQRKLVFKAYAKAVYAANLAAFVSDKEGHHADVRFGWGYCEIIYTSHELGRLSENDFICAAKLDAMLV